MWTAVRSCRPLHHAVRCFTLAPFYITDVSLSLSLSLSVASTANWAKWSTTTASTSGSNITIIGSGSSANSTASGGTNSTTTPTPSSSVSVSSTASSGSSSNVIMFAGIGVGVLVLLIVIIAICKRRKNQARRRNTNPHGGRHSKRDRAKTRTKHEEAFGGGGGYNNVLDTSKNGGYGSYQRKISEPAMMEDGGRDSDRSYVSDVPTEEALSVDGMLGDPPQTPVVLGGGPSRMTTGKSMGNKSAFTSVNDLVNQDISIRCTTSANVFDEYLRMKQEMNYDHDDDAMSEVMSEMSDYESDTMSMHKFSLESSQGLVRHDGGLSITDSEYDEHLRNRGASECYSEMSYNDEKYSFSEDDDMSSELGRSKVGADREVEI